MKSQLIKNILGAACVSMTAFFNVQAQNITISLSDTIADDQFKKSQAIVPVYLFKGMEVEPYTRFGTDYEDLVPLKIKKMPPMQGITDTAYSYLYFSGADNPENQGYLLTVIGNYRRYLKDVLFWVDRNNNLDLSDDGPPDTLNMKHDSLVLTLKNLKIPEATYRVRLSRVHYGENVRYKKLLTEHYKKHSGNKAFTDINYCYREQRYNVRTGYYKTENDSFTIAVKDLNTDGLYGQPCLDQMYVGPYKKEVKQDDFFDIVPSITGTAFEWNRKKYSLVDIDNLGSQITVKENPNAVLSNKLEIGKKVPPFTFFNIENEEIKLKKYKKKPTYIFFWDKEVLSEEDTLYLGKIHRELSDKIQLITLNHGDDPKEVRIYHFYEKIKWPIGFSTQHIAEDLFMEEPPTGYYLGSKLKLINDNITPKEMYELISGSEG